MTCAVVIVCWMWRPPILWTRCDRSMSSTEYSARWLDRYGFSSRGLIADLLMHAVMHDMMCAARSKSNANRA